MANKKNKGGGCVLIVIGPAIVFAAIAALWQNETRYDYYKAAKKTTAVHQANDADEGMLFSLTGSMDQSRTMPGKYIQAFQGFLSVKRSAEIYAWDRDEDDEGHVTWSRRWMGSVEQNSRNGGLSQQLDSGTIMPPSYEIGDLTVTTDQVEFVDSFEKIDATNLPLSELATNFNLKPAEGRLFYRKFSDDGVGDERLTYRGLVIPSTATYFGKFSNGRGVAHDAEKRSGLISQIIQDSGILHHVVAGDRETALNTMRVYLSRLKWIVRGIGTFAVISGFFLTFAAVFQVLFRIPFFGRIAEYGVWLMAIIIGFPVALLTIALAYTFSHPVFVIGVFVVVFGGLFFLAKQKQKTQKAIKNSLDRHYGHELTNEEMKELEFHELACLALGDSEFGHQEKNFLFDWGKKHGWDKAYCEELLQKAKMQREARNESQPSDEHLHNLIKLALADGTLSHYEVKTIRTAAFNVGYDRDTVDELMTTIEQSALAS